MDRSSVLPFPGDNERDGIITRRYRCSQFRIRIHIHETDRVTVHGRLFRFKESVQRQFEPVRLKDDPCVSLPDTDRTFRAAGILRQHFKFDEHPAIIDAHALTRLKPEFFIQREMERCDVMG